MDLKENVGVGKFPGNAVVGCVDDDGDSGLRHPGEGFGQEVIQPVEVPAGEAKLVGDGASGVEVVENTLVPLGDRGVELEPHPLEVRGFGEGDFQRGRASGWLPAVVGISSNCAPSIIAGKPESGGDRRTVYSSGIVDNGPSLQTGERTIIYLYHMVTFSLSIVGS